MSWAECLRLMANGDYDHGFPAHEDIRTGSPKHNDIFEQTPTFGKPIWRGNRVERLLVNADFGMGDTIQFYRFVPMARERVNSLVLRCDEDFKSLFGPEAVGKTESLGNCSHVIHMMALPRVLGLGTSGISGNDYLRPDRLKVSRAKERQTLSLVMEDALKVGVCTRGNPFNPRDGARSIPVELEHLLPGLLCPGLRPIWLCKHAGPPSPQYLDVRALMADWNDTADLLVRLDLVISVDTAVAHLAGALGVPCWLLLPQVCDWRWGTGDRTPWYESVRIFRQGTGGWQGVFDQVRDHLKSFSLLK